MDDEVRASIEQVIEYYRSIGYQTKEVSLPTTDLSIPVYYVIATAEASSNLARYDGIRYTSRSERAENAIDVYAKSRGEGFGSEVKRRCILEAYALSSGYYDAYYLRAQKARTLIRQDFEKAFAEVDASLPPPPPLLRLNLGRKVMTLSPCTSAMCIPFRPTLQAYPVFPYPADFPAPVCPLVCN